MACRAVALLQPLVFCNAVCYCKRRLVAIFIRSLFYKGPEYDRLCRFSLAVGTSKRIVTFHRCSVSSQSQYDFFFAGRTDLRQWRVFVQFSGIPNRLKPTVEEEKKDNIFVQQVVSELRNNYNFLVLFNGAVDHSGNSRYEGTVEFLKYGQRILVLVIYIAVALRVY
ncbi:hypothetical protein M9H77_17449 [Catharanthus roseus]|uniref:Uncharacterized protein n=1 Tax=Catharanthus roseus TaxID=4058 RepID=A0ACC0B4N5_CATRO|nr:hypothetical protein M9H77_17449 [Catharanthus roseus]